MKSLAWFAFFLTTAAYAQSERSPTLLPVTAPVRDAGVYHLANGTWTRRASAAIGAEIIYNNTCFSGGYFVALRGDRFVDEGRIPSPTSPDNLNSKPGCARSYTVDGFQFAYCTDQPSLGSVEMLFVESYLGCSTLAGVTPTAGFLLPGLPASQVPGSQRCWTVTIDLASPPQSSSLAFIMRADGDGFFDFNDNFGWSIESDLPDDLQLQTGPILSGDPNLCTGYDGTRWDPVVDYSEAGTGMGTQDQFRFENGPTTPGCYYPTGWPGNPFSSFHLELYSGDPCPPQPAGTAYCSGDGSATPCPCGNSGSTGHGCANSVNLAGATLSAIGNASISSDTVVLSGSGMPNGQALYFQGTIQTNDGMGLAFGDGLRCVGATIARLGIKTNVNGESQYPEAGDPPVSVQGQVSSPATRYYQVWYRNAADFCTSATHNMSNGYTISWQP